MSQHIKRLKKLKGVKFWQYVIDHKNDLKITLDNDSTIITLLNDDDSEEYVRSPEYLGDSLGVMELLDAIGIHNDRC